MIDQYSGVSTRPTCAEMPIPRSAVPLQLYLLPLARVPVGVCMYAVAIYYSRLEKFIKHPGLRFGLSPGSWGDGGGLEPVGTEVQRAGSPRAAAPSSRGTSPASSGTARVEERVRSLHQGWRSIAERFDVMAESGHARVQLTCCPSWQGRLAEAEPEAV